ncbi:hypothetical protein U1Q18_041087 [Sarracenia purpurea var. burkii]
MKSLLFSMSDLASVFGFFKFEVEGIFGVCALVSFRGGISVLKLLVDGQRGSLQWFSYAEVGLDWAGLDFWALAIRVLFLVFCFVIGEVGPTVVSFKWLFFKWTEEVWGCDVVFDRRSRWAMLFSGYLQEVVGPVGLGGIITAS